MADAREREPLLRGSDDRMNAENGIRKPNIVEFDEEGDEDNPLEWSSRYKWFSVVLLFGCAAIVTYTCIGIVPVAGDVVKELTGHKDRTATVLFVTIWEVGEATGPLFISPLSETYGRFVVYNVANLCFISGIVLTALSQNIGLLIFSRFATGCAVAANCLNPAIIGDMFPSESRGSAMSAVMLAPLIGGALGPTVCGSLAEATGWRGVMWLCVAVASVIEITFLFFFRETYRPTILKRRAKKKREETGDDSWTTQYDLHVKNTGQAILYAMSRPLQIIWSSSMLQLLSIWGGLSFSFFYVNSTSLPEILEVVYGYGPALRGYCYLAWTGGSCLGLVICNRGMDPIYRNLVKRYGPSYPEGRLPLTICGAWLFPIATALYGWVAQARLHVSIYLISVSLLSLCVVLSVVPLFTFLTDAFGTYSASALTAVLVTRCLMGAFLPLTVPPLADKIGYGYAFSVLAAACLLLAPIPPLVMRYGPRWRQRSSFTKDL